MTEYSVTSADPRTLENWLNDKVKRGWKLVSLVPELETNGYSIRRFTVVLMRDTPPAT